MPGSLEDPAARVRPAPGHGWLEHLIDRCQGYEPLRAAVVYPVDESALRGALDARRAGIVAPVLVGPARRMADVARRAGMDIDGVPTVDAADEETAAAAGVHAVRAGAAELLMKGSLHTSAFLHAVFERGSGLRGPHRASHVFVMDVPAYGKPLFVTDAVVNRAPGLAHKADICRNAIDLARVLGVRRPKVAVLSAVEVADPVLPSTLDAVALREMASRGEIAGALLDGPLALDDAISPGAATIKHITSAVAGDADILVVPDLEAGNILYKSLVCLGRAETAGIVLGTRVPLIVTSRADTVRTRVASAALACTWARR
jgi:phosphate acetyltransferase